MKKTLVVILGLILFSSQSLKAEETYIYGGAKLFNYGIENSDLQEINKSLIALGFSSSLTKTDNSGIGFDIGAGFNLSENLALEVGYVNYGTLEVNTTTTGPVENLKLEIKGTGFTGAGVIKFGDDKENFYLKGGMHSWKFDGKVTASLGSSSEPLGTGTDIIAGAGFNMGNWYASYDYYVIDDGSINSFGIGFKAPF
jgi:hypothetical protein